MKIYLAGPLGFSEAGRAFHQDRIVRKLLELDHTPLDPWSDDPPPGIDATLAAEIKRLSADVKAVLAMEYGTAKRARWHVLNPRIGAKNTRLIDICDAVFAVLDGTDVDSGTAGEIGYAFAKRKPILGYRGDFRLSADNEGSIVNLQVEYFITASGGAIISKIDQLEKALAALHPPLQAEGRSP